MKIDLDARLINLKWTKDQYFKPEILKLVEDNVRNRPHSTGIGRYLLNRTDWTRSNTMNFMRLKRLCTAKETQ